MKPRPVTAVHVDIARFVLEVSALSADSKESTDKLVADWTRGLARCLALRDPALHAYGGHLLGEVEEYRKAEIERKKAKFSAPSKDSAESADSLPRTKQSKTKQSNKEEDTAREPRAPAAHRVKPKAPKTEPEYAPEVYRVYEYWHRLIKASARKADSLKWISRRGTDLGFERLIMAINRYSAECRRDGTEKRYLKECANFFGEDAAFEGFLPDDEFYNRYLTKAQAMLNGGEDVEETK